MGLEVMNRTVKLERQVTGGRPGRLGSGYAGFAHYEDLC